MDKIEDSTLWSFLDGKSDAIRTTNQKIRRGLGHKVTSYFELAQKVAELQFRNRNHVLLFRGQPTDYKTQNSNSSSLLKPTLFRLKGGVIPRQKELEKRFAILRFAERELVEHYKGANLLGIERLERHRILRWAILQHYDVCRTPLLDVTHSVRIAATFASPDPESTTEAYFYAIAVPNISGAITASSEAGLQIVRLSSACPPSAVRPHVQEGYLLGEYPEIADYDQNSHYGYFEMDFGRRLVAKFRFQPKALWWNPDFPPVPERGLLPIEESDPLIGIADQIKKLLKAFKPHVRPYHR